MGSTGWCSSGCSFPLSVDMEYSAEQNQPFGLGLCQEWLKRDRGKLQPGAAVADSAYFLLSKLDPVMSPNISRRTSQSSSLARNIVVMPQPFLSPWTE